MPEEEQQPIPAITINLQPNCLIISHVAAALDENTMNQIVVKWLESHPALLQQLAAQAAQAKKQELQIIRHVKASRND